MRERDRDGQSLGGDLISFEFIYRRRVKVGAELVFIVVQGAFVVDSRVNRTGAKRRSFNDGRHLLKWSVYSINEKLVRIP